MIEDSEPKIPEQFSEWLQESNVLDKLDEPHTSHTENNSQSQKPDSTISASMNLKELLKQNGEEVLQHQIIGMVNEFEARLTKGSLLSLSSTPERWIKDAEKLETNNFMKKWNLRQAASEYIILAEAGDNASEAKALKLLEEILDGNKDLAKKLFDSLIVLIRNN